MIFRDPCRFKRSGTCRVMVNAVTIATNLQHHLNNYTQQEPSLPKIMVDDNPDRKGKRRQMSPSDMADTKPDRKGKGRELSPTATADNEDVISVASSPTPPAPLITSRHPALPNFTRSGPHLKPKQPTIQQQTLSKPHPPLASPNPAHPALPIPLPRRP